MPVSENAQPNGAESRDERSELGQRISHWLDFPLTVLALVMLGLIVLEFAADLSPDWARRVGQAQTAIWVVFAVTFAIEFVLAPSKRRYLRENWVTAISVVLPAFRSIRIFRVARALRGLSLVRLVTTLNRGSRALAHVIQQGQFGYVLALTVVITLVSAAGALYFERGEPGANILSFGDAVWWSSTIITTVNSPLSAVTFEGRVIGLLIRIFGLAASGYLTAIIAVYWLGGLTRPNADEDQAEELRRLREEVAALRTLLAGGRATSAVEDADGHAPAPR